MQQHFAIFSCSIVVDELFKEGPANSPFITVPCQSGPINACFEKHKQAWNSFIQGFDDETGPTEGWRGEGYGTTRRRGVQLEMNRAQKPSFTNRTCFKYEETNTATATYLDVQISSQVLSHQKSSVAASYRIMLTMTEQERSRVDPTRCQKNISMPSLERRIRRF